MQPYIKIFNQNNGRMGQTIHQESTGTNGAVACLARRVHHILQNGGSQSRLLCDVKVSNKWLSVTRQAIVKHVKTGATQMNLAKRGIDPDLLGSHSLRAGGAMALKLQTTRTLPFKSWVAGLLPPGYNIFTLRLRILPKVWPLI